MGIEIIQNNNYEDKSIIRMSEMKPLQVGIIVDDTRPQLNDTYVMRTASWDKPEVMNLSQPGYDKCWVSPGYNSLKIRLLKEPLILKIDNRQ